MNIRINPLGKYVLVESSKVDGGLIEVPGYVPEDAQRVHQRGMEIYRVIAVGEGRLMSDGNIVPHTCKPGDEVLLAPDTPLAGPHKSLFGMENVYLIEAGNVLAIVEGRDGNKLPGPPLPEIVTGRMNAKALVQ